MPELAHRYVNRSAERRAEEARQAQKRRDSWERMKAAVAAKHERKSA